MSNELKPCPFCSDKELPIRLKKEGKLTGMVGHTCHALGIEIRVPEHIWNTRHERTCKVDWREDSWGVCECGGDVYESDIFCSSCGAKVVGE